MFEYRFADHLSSVSSVAVTALDDLTGKSR